jgi:hypothetical protein
MAFSNSTFTDLGTGVSDLFQASADQAKAKFDIAEQQEYTLAGNLATQNKQITEQSTAIQQAQINRQNTQVLGKTQAGVAGAGFAESGSALDILRSNAGQGAITKAVASENGLVQEAGYEEQAASYNLMASAAGTAASAEETAAKGADIGAVLGFASSAFSLIGLGGGGGQNPTGPTSGDFSGVGGWSPAAPGL